MKAPRPWWKWRRSRRPQRAAFAFVIVSLASGAWVAHGAYRTLVSYPSRIGEGENTPVAFAVSPGSSLDRVIGELTDAGILPEAERVAFKLFVLQRGSAGKITAGDHLLSSSMTPTEILDELMRRQPAKEVQVTIPEGKNTFEIAAILAEAGIHDQAIWEAAMLDPALAESLGVPGPGLEGFLFPDTYKFRRQATPTEILARMVERHQAVYADLLRRHRSSAKRLATEFKWTQREVVTMASLVEKETGAAQERPLIAGVFLNRLRFPSFQPKRLETDPTIVYGCTVPAQKSAACREFAGRIRKIHLRDTDNPYNTYTHEGLPPGPIANPGRAALEAVFEPTRSRYLYFVKKDATTHQFSASREEHEAAVDTLIRGVASNDPPP